MFHQDNNQDQACQPCCRCNEVRTCPLKHAQLLSEFFNKWNLCIPFQINVENQKDFIKSSAHFESEQESIPSELDGPRLPLKRPVAAGNVSLSVYTIVVSFLNFL